MHATHPWLQTLFSPNLDNVQLTILFVEHPGSEPPPILFKKIVNQIMRNNRRSVDETKRLGVSSHVVALAHLLLLQPLFEDYPEVVRLLCKQQLWWNFVNVRVPLLHPEYFDSCIAVPGDAEVSSRQTQTPSAGQHTGGPRALAPDSVPRPC